MSAITTGSKVIHTARNGEQDHGTVIQVKAPNAVGATWIVVDFADGPLKGRTGKVELDSLTLDA